MGEFMIIINLNGIKAWLIMFDTYNVMRYKGGG